MEMETFQTRTPKGIEKYEHHEMKLLILYNGKNRVILQESLEKIRGLLTSIYSNLCSREKKNANSNKDFRYFSEFCVFFFNFLWIFSPVRVGDNFRMRFNSELYKLLNDVDNVLISSGWAGSAMSFVWRRTRRVFNTKICGSRRRELCWLNYFLECLRYG